MFGIGQRGVGRGVPGAGPDGWPRVRLPGVFLAATVLVVGAACSSTGADPSEDITDEQLLAALLTGQDLGVGYAERARGADLATPATDGPRRVSDDADCQALFDRASVEAAETMPDVSAVFAVEDPAGYVVEGIGVTDPQQPLTQAQAILDCYERGFALEGDAENGSAGPEPTDWVASSVEVAVPGWQIIAYRTQPTSGAPVGESGLAVAGRDSLVVEISINGQAVPPDLLRSVTATALHRVDATLPG